VFRAEAKPLDKKCGEPRFDLKVKYDGAKGEEVDFANLQMKNWKQRNDIKKNWVDNNSCNYPTKLDKECDAKIEKELKSVIDWFDQFFKSNQFACKSKKDVCNLIDEFPELRAESFLLDQEVEKKQHGCKTKTTTTTTTTEPPTTQPPKTKTQTALPPKNETPTALPPTSQPSTAQEQQNNHSSVNVPKIWYIFFASILKAMF